MVPGRTSDDELREVTRPIVCSVGFSRTETVCVWSAKTLTPLCATGSYVAFSTEMVYESGASDRNTKCPFASVVVVTACEGLLADTLAPAMGVPLALSSVTLPLSVPVVPASAHVT